MPNIIFSIIVPVYNIENSLNECIESLIGQSYLDIEIILIDDGSQDKSLYICDSYEKKDDRIKVIHKKNGGPVSARQAGVEIASGEYIVCIDGDDWVDVNYIEKFANVINTYNPDIVCCGYIKASNKDYKENPLPYRYGYYSKADIENELFPMLIQSESASYFMPSLWAKAIRKELFYTYHQQINKELILGEDGACIIPCIYHASSLYIMHECLYYYRYNSSSLTRSGKYFSWDGPKLIAQHLKKQIDISKFDFEEQIYRKIVHELFSVIVSQFYKTEPYKKVVKDILYNMQDPIYKEAIMKCKFKKSVRAGLMSMSLKKKFIIPIWIYSRIKRLINL